MPDTITAPYKVTVHITKGDMDFGTALFDVRMKEGQTLQGLIDDIATLLVDPDAPDPDDEN
jgi:hypothetical protein